MHRPRILPTLFMGASVFLAACGNQGDESDASGGMDETAEMGEARTIEMDIDSPSCYVASGTAEEARGRPSPLGQTEFSVGGHAGLLCYGAPSARGREVMGGLVPYGPVWRAGANEATAIHLSGPASVGGVELAPGGYSLYAEPGSDEWTFYLSSDYQRWGIPITPSVRDSEVGHFTSIPEPMDEMVETLQYRFEPSADGTMGDIVVEWEHTRVKFHVHPGA
jgi:Protein of unknown function (DUF2911)